MPTIQRRGKGYRVMVRLKGRPPQYASFERKRDAEKWGMGVETAIREGRHFTPANPEAGAARKTLADLIDRYVQDVLSSRRKGVKKTAAMLSWWRRELGAYYLPDVTPPLLAGCRDKLLRETTSRGGLRTPATVNRYLGALSHAMSVAAREWMWLDASPLPRVSRPKESRGRVRCLSDTEREALLAACAESRDRRLLALAVLALSTGARQSEIVRLRWRDVDLARRMAILHETKNGERRALSLAGRALEILEAMSAAKRAGAVFVFEDAPVTPIFPRKAWKDAVAAAGLEDCMSLPTEPRGRVGCLSDAQREALLAACAESRDAWSAEVRETLHAPPGDPGAERAYRAALLLDAREGRYFLARQYAYRIELVQPIEELRLAKGEPVFKPANAADEPRLLAQAKAEGTDTTHGTITVFRGTSAILALVQRPADRLYALVAPGAAGGKTCALDRIDWEARRVERLALSLPCPGHVSMAAGRDGLYFAEFDGNDGRYFAAWTDLDAARWTTVKEAGFTP